MPTSPTPSPAADSASAESRPNPDAARPSSFAAVPGWLLSGTLHAAVIVFLVTSGIPSCGDEQIGTGADHGDFREVGIYIKEPTTSPERPEEQKDEELQNNQSQTAAATSSAAPSTQETDAAAKDLIDLPDVKPRSVIGQSAAVPPPSGVPDVSEATVTANSIYTPPAKGDGPGDVSFMGQTSPAQTVVYVIDTSSSMSTNNAIGFARQKLMQSINGLNQKQEFQIISYTHLIKVMHLGNDKGTSSSLYRATRPNLNLAAFFINSLGANGGTKHMPALQAALDLKPDVIFLLTDADQDRLSAGDLFTIRAEYNKGHKTHINCIQFGEGPNLKTPAQNFLQQLASENRGTYSYMDISKLESPGT